MRCGKSYACAVALALLLAPCRGQSQPRDPGPMSKTRARTSSASYETREIEGWTVLVNEEFLRKKATLAEQTLILLRFQLYQIARRLPRAAVAKLRKVRIWVEEDEPNTPCMAYHPNLEWLRDHGVNPEKHRCVELANARNFLDWTLQQPWMVLHELSHAYHHQFLRDGFENAQVKAAYDRAMKSKIYAKVLRINGREERAYAESNPMEYFAEATEAFFGTNDFYPFVRAELRRHDPDADDLLAKSWGVDQAKVVKKTAHRSDRKASPTEKPRA